MPLYVFDQHIQNGMYITDDYKVCCYTVVGTWFGVTFSFHIRSSLLSFALVENKSPLVSSRFKFWGMLRYAQVALHHLRKIIGMLFSITKYHPKRKKYFWSYFFLVILFYLRYGVRLLLYPRPLRRPAAHNLEDK